MTARGDGSPACAGFGPRIGLLLARFAMPLGYILIAMVSLRLFRGDN
jgi:hypothetical protein